MEDPVLGPHSAVTISIGFVHAMLAPAMPRAAVVADVLNEVGIAEELLQYPGARVTAVQFGALFRGLCVRLEDECLGLLSRPFKRGSYALMAQSSLPAQNLEQAVRRIINTFGVLQDDMRLELAGDRKLAGVALHFTNPGVAGSSFLHVLLLRSFWRLLDWLVGGGLPVERFDMGFATPPDAASYSDLFNAPVRFGQPVSALWFDGAQLQSLVRVDESGLRDFLTDPLTRFFYPRRANDEHSAKVRAHLQQSKPAWPDLDATAAALFTSAASLQRNLAKEGTTFLTLKDTLRRDMAITYLNSTAISLAELADLLGFSESASFQRAFKVWTGSAPGSYRRGEK
ncbi:transcriptional regulator, araC family [Janthinobacterium sp. HH01]|uniref:AraC family transcriptional regulator n=1 Tax=Janthinobacterium sp. HH01 TaxID=1198452 RepID=UPI0002AEA76C|nr:AraC family transcriptional regulator [Janthinobacterium sp. HH01]ELX09247.1 transcriptional regulator, araC family [Janthinobacterium sp. HH01]